MKNLYCTCDKNDVEPYEMDHGVYFCENCGKEIEQPEPSDYENEDGDASYEASVINLEEPKI